MQPIHLEGLPASQKQGRSKRNIIRTVGLVQAMAASMVSSDCATRMACKLFLQQRMMGVTMDGERPAHYGFCGSIWIELGVGWGRSNIVNKAKLEVAIHTRRTLVNNHIRMRVSWLKYQACWISIFPILLLLRELSPCQGCLAEAYTPTWMCMERGGGGSEIKMGTHYAKYSRIWRPP